jgi:hypothetical protein
MSKKAILFVVILIGSGLVLLLEYGPFLKNDDTPSPDAMITLPAVSTAPHSADEMLDETVKSEATIDAETEDLFSSVEWRDRESLSQDEYPRTYAELRALAEEGDVEATRRLAELLRICRPAVLPITEAEISAIVAEMRATYSYPMLRDGKFEFLVSATGELSHKMSAAEFNEFLDQWHSNVVSIARVCNDVTLAQRKEADHWRDVFEAQGGVSTSWREATRDMDRDEKIEYIDIMWATGDPHALSAYAEIYGDHELQLIDPSARMKSCAYIYAFYEAMIETAKYHSDADGLASLQWAQRSIRETHCAFLSEYELREAYELARQTIADNENCCMRLPPTLYR